MSILKKIKNFFNDEDENLTEIQKQEKDRKEKKEYIDNLTDNNDYLNDRVHKLFDLLDD